MSGDKYKRREVAEGTGVYQCGCRWTREPGNGDVLDLCALHRAHTKASVVRFERVQRTDRA